MRLLALLELVIWDPSMLADWTVKFTSPKLSGLSLKPTLIQVKFKMTDCIKYNFFFPFRGQISRGQLETREEIEYMVWGFKAII